MKKKLFAILLIALMATTGLFAANGDFSEDNYQIEANGATFTGLATILRYSLGIIPPAIIVGIFMWKLVMAYMNIEQDPQKVKKTAIQFLFVVVIGIGWYFLVGLITSTSNNNAAGNFMTGLQGASAAFLPK